MKVFVDIDETICYYEGIKQTHATVNSIDYSKAKPHIDRIQKINKLYDEGNTIVYWTARGSRSGLNWFQLTLKQLNEWNAKFTELRLGKPHYDLFIDDKNINSENYFS
tara:strand:- start:3782 stop:4105 length:324 start_codon:yes stop_codon:yes gene_type:complete